MQSLELDDATALKIETSSFRRPRRKWGKGPIVAALIFTVLVAVFVAVAVRDGPQNSQEQVTKQQHHQQQQHEAQAQGSESSTSSTKNDDSESPTSSTKNENPSTDFCAQLYDCQTDRIGHETPLLAGQALCNDVFRFGVTPDGIFQWHDCAAPLTKVIYENTTISYFSMSSEGTFRVMDANDKVIWRKEPKVSISYYKECLPRPLLDCPYLHLHKDGTVVLNSIESRTGIWSDRNIERAFDDLFQA